MTTAAPKPTLAKQLKEHLQDQQEPFNLSTYLSERRYTLKKSSSDGANTCCSAISTKNRKEPYMNKQRSFNDWWALKSLLYKLFAPENDRQELSTCHKDGNKQVISETIDMMQQIAETNWFSVESKGREFSTSPGSCVPQNSPSLEHDKDSIFAATHQPLNLRHF